MRMFTNDIKTGSGNMIGTPMWTMEENNEAAILLTRNNNLWHVDKNTHEPFVIAIILGLFMFNCWNKIIKLGFTNQYKCIQKTWYEP